MKEYYISSREAGLRTDTWLIRTLPGASRSFIYKMLRKKNITLNKKKAAGNEKLAEGDCIRIFFSDETLGKFSGPRPDGNNFEKPDVSRRGKPDPEASFPYTDLDIIYEDEHVLLVNKPAGMLSQKGTPQDISLNEYIIGYLLRSGQISSESLRTVRPSVCNRLDRNTSGIVAAGKTTAALQGLGELFACRNLSKYYQCIVCGDPEEAFEANAVCTEKSADGNTVWTLEAYLKKDASSNRSVVRRDFADGFRKITTRFEVGRAGRGCRLVRAELVTGRSHQIRAQLAWLGNPILGDPKYGNAAANRKARDLWKVSSQLLHAGRIEFPEHLPPALAGVAGRCFDAPLPCIYEEILCQPGKQEGCAAVLWKN